MTRYGRDEYADLYTQVCDVVERNYLELPLVDGPADYPEDDFSAQICHTSDEARAAAVRIFEILGVELAKGGK